MDLPTIPSLFGNQAEEKPKPQPVVKTPSPKKMEQKPKILTQSKISK